MRFITAAAISLAAAAPLTAQTTIHLAAGAVGSTNIVRDVLREPLALRPGIAPQLALAISHTLSRQYRIGVEAQFASSSLDLDDDGFHDNLGTISTITAMVIVDGPITRALRYQIGAGAISYRPGERVGVFADGGGTRWLLGAGLSWTRALSAQYGIVVNARYDFHQFITPRLTSRDYSQGESVHRVGVMIGLERSL